MKASTALLICIPLIANAQLDSTYKGIIFEKTTDWEQVKAKAKAENKYIFLDCYATWCIPCKRMDEKVFSHWRIGAIMNDKFISVKVQIDSTAKDNAQIKSWYTDAHRIKEDYQIGSVPTYLFFSPQAKLVHRESGYKDLARFIKLTELARDPQKELYYSQYEKYRQGKKEYSSMGDLAVFTRKLIGDRELAKEIAKDYKKNYLDSLDKEVLYNKEHLDFIAQFPTLITSKDGFFAICYNQPEKVDSIKKSKNWARHIIYQTITREEIEDKVLKNGLPVTTKPNWKKFQVAIAQKYKSVDAKRIVLEYKITYYKDIKRNWTLWAKFKDKWVRTYSSRILDDLDIYTDINGWGGAWAAFMDCDDRKVLKKALKWVNLAIKLDGQPGKVGRASYLDTKANLLYKLGKQKRALKLQKEAVMLSNHFKDIVENYEKMQIGEPTWNIIGFN